MTDVAELAHDTIEEHHNQHHGETHARPQPDPWARRVALLVAILAAVLAMAEIGGKAAQNLYLTHHIAVSDNWAFYQARNLRATVKDSEADLLASLPNAQDPAIQARIVAARKFAARMRDDPQGGEGMKQLAAKARGLEDDRTEAYHRYHDYEFVVGALEIAITLASVSIVTRIPLLAVISALLGVAAAVGAAGIALHLV
jgi:hypothetical protein